MNAVLILSILITIIGAFYLLVKYIRENAESSALATMFTGAVPSNNVFSAAEQKLHENESRKIKKRKR